MSDPLDLKLYQKVKKRADKKFSSKTGIYKSSWIVREYKKLGGRYKSSKKNKDGLTRWFKEKWVDLNRPIRDSKGKVVGYKECGRKSSKMQQKYPLCRPSRRVTSKTPRTIREISKKSIRKAQYDKRLVTSRGNVKFGGAATDTVNNNTNVPMLLSIGMIILYFLQ